VKPAAVLAVITFLAIPVVAEVIALAETTYFPPVSTAVPGKIYLNPPRATPPDLNIPLNMPPGTHPFFNLGTPVPGDGGLSPKTLAPGIYETRPYAMMLKVPESTADHCVIHDLSPPLMPTKHPEFDISKIATVLPVKK
jgi:hypothetical protein